MLFVRCNSIVFGGCLLEVSALDAGAVFSFGMSEPFSRGGDVVCQWRWLCLLGVSALLEATVLYIGGNGVSLGRC